MKGAIDRTANNSLADPLGNFCVCTAGRSADIQQHLAGPNVADDRHINNGSFFTSTIIMGSYLLGERKRFADCAVGAVPVGAVAYVRGG